MVNKSDLTPDRIENRREFSRVPAFAPFAFRIVSPSDIDYMKARTLSDSFLTGFPTMPNVDDQMYGDWFKLINAKLDELIRMSAMQREGFSTLPFKKISISGNGMSFFSPEVLENGTVIEGQIVLTIINPVALFLYGIVVQTESLENGCQVAVRFINMDESIRNEIIRFVFEREREMIREKRGS